MSTFLFLDTNIYLHYRDFDSIPWKSLFKDSATIVIPPLNIRELNKHKDTPSSPRIKRRAGGVLKKLGELFETNLIVQLNDDVKILLEDRDPQISFAAYQLSPEVNDDQLIASIMMLQDELPGSITVLVTSDTGLTLRAKAQRLKIQTMRLPDEYKLPDEPDPEQIKIRDMEAQIRALQAMQPNLSVTFEDELARVRLTFNTQKVPNPEEILHDLREQYPKLAASPTQDLQDSVRFRSVIDSLSRGPLNSISPEDVKSYNLRLDKFYEEYSRYLQQDAQYRVVLSRSAKLQLWLLNTGTAPAKDIDVFLHFPDGFQLFDPEEFPDAPKPPKPPEMPLTQFEKITGIYRSSNPIFSLPYSSFSSTSPSREPNVSYPTIKRTNSYDVSYEVQNVKHGLPEYLGELLIVFDSLQSAHSFHVDYEILAANVPHKVSGKLHVIV